MRRLRIHHLTRYQYAETVTLGPHILHLRPRDGHDIRVQSSKLDISPGFRIHWKRDVYDNSVAVVDFQQSARELTIASEVVVENYEEQPLDFVLEDYARSFPFDYDPDEQIDLAPYKSPVYEQDQAMVNEWLADLCNPANKVDTINMLTTLNTNIANGHRYHVREEPGVQSPSQTLSSGTGSCRDFATLFIESCRHCGLASRFISGYVRNETFAPWNTATHAWAEVYLPGSGWRGFDPTSGLLVSGDHIAVAVHRHPEAVPPVSGSFVGTGNAQPIMTVEVNVAPVAE
ncbi:MAG: transglutaminase family protein [Gammaproteobacteria bacterium]|jgi:transglutaminase-like putative cysteine protease